MALSRAAICRGSSARTTTGTPAANSASRSQTVCRTAANRPSKRAMPPAKRSPPRPARPARLSHRGTPPRKIYPEVSESNSYARIDRGRPLQDRILAQFATRFISQGPAGRRGERRAQIGQAVIGFNIPRFSRQGVWIVQLEKLGIGFDHAWMSRETRRTSATINPLHRCGQCESRGKISAARWRPGLALARFKGRRLPSIRG